MTDFKDYAHLYLGCDVQCTKDMPASYGWITGITVKMDRDILWDMTEPVFFAGIHLGHFYDFIKPILRPLSSMTPRERLELSRLDLQEKIKDLVKYQAIRTKWYLSKHFDIFGLIEAGLAIDATTLKATE